MDDRVRSRLIEQAKTLRREAPVGLRGLEFAKPQDAVLVNDLNGYPHAFVVGCVMDRNVKSERAWEIPTRIQERVGSFKFEDLLSLSAEQIVKAFERPRPLHRFPNRMARLFHSAIQRISDEWRGDARNIWAGKIGSATLVRRFLSFDGVGPKIATMAANVLVRDFRIELSDLHYVDISVDAHVKRVFQRLGLVSKGASNFDVVYAARELNPVYPGIFDFVCWEIGREWCHPGKPDCSGCYMDEFCPGANRFHEAARNDL